MLKDRSPQESFFGSYLYDKIVPANHLLRKINAVVDFSFVNDIVRDRYTPDFGRPAEDPEFMLRLCLLQYLYGDSDREVIANAKLNLAYKYFLGLAVDEDVPDDTTISVFRTKRLGEEKFREVFQNIVQQCIDKGLVTGKRQIVDSTHIIADMAINSLSGLIKLCRRNVIQDITRQSAKTADKLGTKEVSIRKQDRFAKVEESLEAEVEDARHLLDGVTSELKLGNLRATPELSRSLELLEKAVSDRAEGAKDRLVSPVDPDARAGKKDHQHWAGYKGHMVIEEESEIITAVETTPANKDDGNQLKPLLSQQKTGLDLIPKELSADKAYGIGVNLDILESKGITGYISLKDKYNTKRPDLFTRDDFTYDSENNTLTCPAGCIANGRKDLALTGKARRNGIVFDFSRHQCKACELRPLCHNGSLRVHGRQVHINAYEPYYQRMKTRMASKEGKEAYRNRYKIEHKVADLARYCGMRRCRYRGLTKAKIHTLLSAIVSNIKRMARLLWTFPESPPKVTGMAS